MSIVVRSTQTSGWSLQTPPVADGWHHLGGAAANEEVPRTFKPGVVSASECVTVGFAERANCVVGARRTREFPAAPAKRHDDVTRRSSARLRTAGGERTATSPCPQGAAPPLLRLSGNRFYVARKKGHNGRRMRPRCTRSWSPPVPCIDSIETPCLGTAGRIKRANVISQAMKELINLQQHHEIWM